MCNKRFDGQQLKQLRDKMKQAQKRVNQQMEKDRQVARQLVVDGKRDRALLLLKRKKRMEKTLLDLDCKLELLEKMVSDIEFAEIEMKLVDGLKTGNSVLQQLNQLLNVENIDSILQETKESAERQKVSLIHPHFYSRSLPFCSTGDFGSPFRWFFHRRR